MSRSDVTVTKVKYRLLEIMYGIEHEIGLKGDGMELVKRVESLSSGEDYIYKVLGVEKETYNKLFKSSLEEFNQILKTGKFTLAGLKLLRWLGVEDEKINVELLVKAIAVIKTTVHFANKCKEKKSV